MKSIGSRTEKCCQPTTINPDKVYLRPLNMKFGLIKNFVKGINRDSPGLHYLRKKLPKTSDANIVIFVGPQIQELVIDNDFNQ